MQDNNCPDEVVDSLLNGVRSAGVPLCKRYYALKKQILQQTQGLESFKWSDRNAPIDISDAKEEKIEWETAVNMVERGYRKFSPKMSELFMDMVNEKRIDVPATDGKKGGAYCAGVVPGIGPFQLLNFDGTKQDVATLAHESGHGCHDILAYKQGYLQYHPPLTLAETASIFGEMIVFRDLLDIAETPEEKLTLLMSKIDDVINSVVRQCSFDRFEELAHTARENGELSSEELDAFWMQALQEYYGVAGEEDCPFDEYADVNALWSYVPHFHHSRQAVCNNFVYYHTQIIYNFQHSNTPRRIVHEPAIVKLVYESLIRGQSDCAYWNVEIRIIDIRVVDQSAQFFDSLVERTKGIQHLPCKSQLVVTLFQST